MYCFMRLLNMLKLLLCSCLTLFFINVTYATEHIESIRVLDGDTIEVTHKNAEIEVLRLSNIDAPEAAQEYGFRSARNLHGLLGESPSKIHYRVDFVDAYKRKNATVFVKNENINIQQVKDGYAWVSNKSIAKAFQDAQYSAKKFGRGLWATNTPNPPWVFRRNLK